MTGYETNAHKMTYSKLLARRGGCPVAAAEAALTLFNLTGTDFYGRVVEIASVVESAHKAYGGWDVHDLPCGGLLVLRPDVLRDNVRPSYVLPADHWAVDYYRDQLDYMAGVLPDYLRVPYAVLTASVGTACKQ